MVALSKMEVGMLDPCLRGDISVSLEALKPWVICVAQREENGSCLTSLFRRPIVSFINLLASFPIFLVSPSLVSMLVWVNELRLWLGKPQLPQASVASGKE